MTKKPAPQPIDFAKVDSLRKHMLLTVGDMAEVLKLSRQSYYTYLRSSTSPRGVKLSVVKGQVKKLLDVMAKGWPSPDIIASSQTERKAKLLELLEQPA